MIFQSIVQSMVFERAALDGNADTRGWRAGSNEAVPVSGTAACWATVATAAMSADASEEH